MFLPVLIVISAISFSYGFLDWSNYRAAYLHSSEAICYLHLHGGLYAPDQYRIGVWMLACGVHSHMHLHLWLVLTLIDVISLWLTLFCLARLLTESTEYKSFQKSTKIFSFAVLFFFVAYVLPWGHWFQYAETMFSCLFVSLSALLASGKIFANRTVACAFMIGMSFCQGFVRADVAVVLHAGFFLAMLLPFLQPIPMGRIRQALTSGVAAFCAGGVQLYLMRVRFPTTIFWVRVFMVLDNLHPGQWLTALLALLPFWTLFGMLAARKYRLEGIAAMLMVSSLLYFCVWFVLGLLDETRIFFPFCLVMLPTSSLACIHIADVEKRSYEN
jgi:hypothetical protein